MAWNAVFPSFPRIQLWPLYNNNNNDNTRFHTRGGKLVLVWNRDKTNFWREIVWIYSSCFSVETDDFFVETENSSWIHVQDGQLDGNCVIRAVKKLALESGQRIIPSLFLNCPSVQFLHSFFHQTWLRSSSARFGFLCFKQSETARSTCRTIELCLSKRKKLVAIEFGGRKWKEILHFPEPSKKFVNNTEFMSKLAGFSRVY